MWNSKKHNRKKPESRVRDCSKSDLIAFRLSIIGYFSFATSNEKTYFGKSPAPDNTLMLQQQQLQRRYYSGTKCRTLDFRSGHSIVLYFVYLLL